MAQPSHLKALQALELAVRTGSLKDAAAHCDEARELLRKLREVAE